MCVPEVLDVAIPGSMKVTYSFYMIILTFLFFSDFIFLFIEVWWADTEGYSASNENFEQGQVQTWCAESEKCSSVYETNNRLVQKLRPANFWSVAGMWWSEVWMFCTPQRVFDESLFKLAQKHQQFSQKLIVG